MPGMELSRRRFLAGAAAGSAGALVPLDLLLRAAAAAAAAQARFFTPQEYATAGAICSRIVPTDQDPGALEARAVDFIDLFLAAFELPPSVADNPAVYVRGRYSGRNPYPDYSTGQPSATYPASDAADPITGRRHFLSLSRLQQLSWRAQLYGAAVIVGDASLPRAYRDAVAGGLVPLPPPLRDTYRKGLRAFDAYAHQLFEAGSFDRATPEQQDVMLSAAANPLLANVP